MAIEEEEFALENQRAELKALEEAQPLLGPKEDFTSLITAYENNTLFSQKIQELMQTHSHRRSVRGDGNCFYRSYVFSICEQRLNGNITDEQFNTIFNTVQNSFTQLCNLGYPEYTTEDFHASLMEIFNLMVANADLETILEKFCQEEDMFQLYYIYWIRLMTSLHIQLNADNFLPYVLEYGSIKQFCSSQIEPPKHDADQVQCIALQQFLGVPLRIYYLDQSAGSINHFDFGDSDPVVHLLYRPGHYDVIYPNAMDVAEEQ